MSVTLSEVKRAARAHRAPLAGESAGYLVLAIADQVLKAPRLVHEAEIQLTDEGALRVVSGRASSDVEAELALRRTLDQLLLVASSGSAALTRASRRTAPLGLSSLVRELEAALIPVNRSAARRALARVHRETVRALDSGNLPEDEQPQCAAPATLEPPLPELPAVAAPVAPPAPAALLLTTEAAVEPLAGSLAVEPREPNQNPEPALDLDQDLETPALPAPTLLVPAEMAESELDGVVSALCQQLLAPPQFVESDALTSALPVRPVSPPAPAVSTEPEAEFLLEIDVEFATDALDSGAAPTVMRAVQVEPVTSSGNDPGGDPLLLELPLEARTRPEPVVLRKALRPLLDLLPQPITDAVEPLPQTPTLGALATHLPILQPEQIAELTIAATAAAELLQSVRESDDRTERMPEALPLPPGAALTLAMVESKKSDVKELLESFQVAEPSSNQGLCRAIKELADLDLTPAPFAALIR